MSSRNINAVLALAITGALAGTGCAAQSDGPVIGGDEATAVEALAPSDQANLAQAVPTEKTGEAQEQWLGGWGWGRGFGGWGGLGWGGWGGLGWGGWGGLGWGGLGWGGGWWPGLWGGWGGCGGCGGWGGGWW
jgi:hypothetical protein